MATPTELYVQWRAGDPQAAPELARRFTDWYQAIAQARLGPDRAAGPFARTCSRFQGGILNIRNPVDLVPWAHSLIAEELNREESGAPSSDLAEGRLARLQQALEALPPATRALLMTAYGPGRESLTALAAPLGGLPFALLEARDALKAALAALGERFPDAGVVPDHAPLPYYEAGRTTPEEASAIETWLLSEPLTCRDLVAFAPWTHALRVYGAVQASKAPAADLPEGADAPRSARSVVPAEAGGLPWMWIGLGGVAVLAAAGWFLVG